MRVWIRRSGNEQGNKMKERSEAMIHFIQFRTLFLAQSFRAEYSLPIIRIPYPLHKQSGRSLGQKTQSSQFRCQPGRIRPLHNHICGCKTSPLRGGYQFQVPYNPRPVAIMYGDDSLRRRRKAVIDLISPYDSTFPSLLRGRSLRELATEKSSR